MCSRNAHTRMLERLDDGRCSFHARRVETNRAALLKESTSKLGEIIICAQGESTAHSEV